MELGTWCRDSARAQLSFQIRPGKAITKTRVQPASNMSIANTRAPIADWSVSRRYTGRKGGTADAPPFYFGECGGRASLRFVI